MKLLITAGGTREPIDAVRYIGNRSSGRLGVALAQAALSRGIDVTLVLGSATASPPEGARLERVETTGQMLDVLRRLWPEHDALVMAAAVADFAPKRASAGKLHREEGLSLELEPTPDLLAEMSRLRRPGQRIVGFSLDEDTPEARTRAGEKIRRKGVDLLVFNPLATMDSAGIEAELIWPDGDTENLGLLDKHAFAEILVERVERLMSQELRP